MNIILHQPEIPANTGNIGRTCVATNTVLHLIEPLGFRLNEKEIKRAGMDYWEHLDVRRYINFEEFTDNNEYYFTLSRKKIYINGELVVSCVLSKEDSPSGAEITTTFKMVVRKPEK